eukprot:CAMPEP_0175154888 /NCGR_PEP_ID=MMETSP0087-20121206/20642_1 /TAXON_ID=136419 /ORGANISM="Unknown Unknown, Strain D1" /LENGTH=198 /DNA_ID=CAMNT_0016441927 /DNA_START=30 /DNA_END=623 /DNA_ORIENTATION=+
MPKPEASGERASGEQASAIDMIMVHTVSSLIVMGLTMGLNDFKKPIWNWVKQNLKLVAATCVAIILGVGVNNPEAVRIVLKEKGFHGTVITVIVNICEAAKSLVVFLIKSGSLAALGLKSGVSRFGGPQSSVLAVVVAAVLVLSQMQVVGTVGAVLASAFRNCRNRFKAEEREQVGQEKRPDAATGRTIFSNKLLWLP